METKYLRRLVGRELSNRAASWVAARILQQHGMPVGPSLERHAKEHLERNGGVPSDKAKIALAKFRENSLAQLEEAVTLLRTLERVQTELNRFRQEEKALLESLAEFYCPALRKKREAEERRMAEEGADWWEREGKYEEALEDSGYYKDYLYECQRAEQFGEEPPSPKEFYLGL